MSHSYERRWEHFALGQNNEIDLWCVFNKPIHTEVSLQRYYSFKWNAKPCYLTLFVFTSLKEKWRILLQTFFLDCIFHRCSAGGTKALTMCVSSLSTQQNWLMQVSRVIWRPMSLWWSKKNRCPWHLRPCLHTFIPILCCIILVMIWFE